MSDSLNVCAIVLDYRRADLTAQCLESLAGQVKHVAVVDNSASAAHSERLTSRLKGLTDPPVTVFRPGRNLGYGAGVNFALRQLGNTFEAFLLVNNDARLEPGAVAKLVSTQRALGCKALVAPAGTHEGAPLQLWYQPALGLVTRRPVWGAFSYLSGACLLVPRAVAAGKLFDEDFFMYGEDVELAWRLRRTETGAVTVAGLCIAHSGSATEPPGGLFYEYHTVRCHLLLGRKLARTPGERLVFQVCRAVTMLLRAGARSARLRTWAPLQALAMAWRAR